MKNPWLNISLSDTVADCDKPKINSLTTAVKSKIVLDTLPEPYHGDPEAKVYLLNGNPGHSEKGVSRNLVGINFRHPNVMPNFAVWKTITYRHWHRWCCQPRF